MLREGRRLPEHFVGGVILHGVFTESVNRFADGQAMPFSVVDEYHGSLSMVGKVDAAGDNHVTLTVA